MAIIITKNGKNASKIEQRPPEQEDELQQYIFDNPDSLPLDDIKDNAKLLVVGREFDTRSGPIDVLALDGDGDIYIIETKLYKNPDKRHVIAQMLDYGAALSKTYGGGDEFLRKLDELIVESKAGGLRERLATLYKFDEEKVDEIQEQIKRNLSDGNIKFVVLMDKLHERLRDLILFINEKSRFDIFAVEMEFYRHEGIEIVIPKLYGAEVTKDIPQMRPKRTNQGYEVFKQLLDKPIRREDVIATLVKEGFSPATAESYITWSKRLVDDEHNNPFYVETEQYKDENGIRWLRKKAGRDFRHEAGSDKPISKWVGR